MADRIAVSGPLAVEGEITGDGRMLAHNSLVWDGVLPIAIIWDRNDGDHSGATLGAIETIERRPNDVIWGEGYLSGSEDLATQEAVLRARELLEEGAVGVSIRMDSETVEMRVKRELVEVVEEPQLEEAVLETDEDGQRVIVATYSADDVLYVTTSARIRHLAIVDTAAIVSEDGSRFGISGAIAASAMSGDWSACNWMFNDPGFTDPGVDDRLRYDPDRSVWSCPPTVTDDGHYFGHITPMGICLRGRPDKCVTPPEGDLEGFMRGRAPAAGGQRTGTVVCGEGSNHCDVGVGAALATQHYDKVGKAAADVRVGRDRYGVWFSGMIRPGTDKTTVYQLEASDVSGHWEYSQAGRMTLVGLPAVNVGGFPKGYLTYDEFHTGLAASGGYTVDEGCGGWVTNELETIESSDIMARLDQISMAVGELYAAHIRSDGNETA